jgi:hypothetical protein
MRRLIVTANVVPSSPILATLMMEALQPSQTSILTRATRRHAPEECQLNDNYGSQSRCYNIFISFPNCVSSFIYGLITVRACNCRLGCSVWNVCFVTKCRIGRNIE